MDTRVKDEARVVLTVPLSLDSTSEVDYKAPNIFQRIFSLINNIRPGTDLTHIQLPPIFNMPKSQLQCYGESVYCMVDDMLHRCANGKNSIDRLLAVVAWNISTLRVVIFGVAPFNPIIGETHHVSRGTLNVLLEQVSHHPPVSALHATNEKDNIEMTWVQHPIPKFYGSSVEAKVQGKRHLKLLNYGENYVMNSPNLFIRLFPKPSTDWVGKIGIRCEESSLEAEFYYSGPSFLGFGKNQRSVKGKVFCSASRKTIYEIDGHWDRTVTARDIGNGEVKVIYNAKEVVSGLKTPTVKDPKDLWESESAIVWSEVSQCILKKEWEKARDAKKAIEEREREIARERKCNGDTWVSKHFNVSHTKEGGWECTPKHKWVPPAPIVIPL